jgi:hypothetical protein
MRNARIALSLAGLAFGTLEAISAFEIEVPEVAVVFSVGFLGCTAWFWRRSSVAPVLVLGLLFGIEAAVAPTLHGVMTITKVVVFVLGVAGLASAVAVLATQRSVRRTAAASRARPGRSARPA